MKKTLLFVAAFLVMAGGLLAQDRQVNVKFNEDADLSFGNETFSVEPLSYVGWGVITPARNASGLQGVSHKEEFFLNALEFRFHPYSSGQVSIGLDYDRSMFRAADGRLWLPSADGRVVTLVNIGDYAVSDVRKSKLIVNSVVCPVCFEQTFGPVSLRAGVSAVYNYLGRTKFKGEGTDAAKFKADGVGINSFTYQFLGAVSYGGIGIYVKYSPVQVFEEGCGPQFDYLSVGVVYGLGM